MNKSATTTKSRRPLVGERCRYVARPELVGRVIDVAPIGRMLLVELDTGRGEPDWVSFDEVERIPDTPPVHPLIGQAVRIARAVGNGPINHEGHTGTLVEVKKGAGLIELGRLGVSRWVPLANVHAIGAKIEAASRAEAKRANQAEHEGYAEHLDAIERGIR